MKRSLVIGAAAAAILGVIALFPPFYAVNPTEQVIVLQFGAPLAVETEPGLHFKIPWMQTVAYIDKRLLSVEVKSVDVVTQDKKRLLVDAFARWRIADPIRFNARSSSKDIADASLAVLLGSDVRRVLGAHRFAEVLSVEPQRMMDDVRRAMNQETRELGIDIVDVRLRHADLPVEDADTVYKRMQEDETRQAAQIKAEGAEEALVIKAEADRQATVIDADADQQADILKGEADAEKARILGEAYGQDKDFFAFYRSMQAYQDALSSANTTAILSPHSDFFRYFLENPEGATGGKARH